MSQDFEVSLDEETMALIQRRLDQIPSYYEQGLRDFATTLYRLLIGATPVGIKKNPDGHAKYRWERPVETGSFTHFEYTIRNPAPYAHVLERGLYSGVGPRTMRATDPFDGHSGIYSRQAPGGMYANSIAQINVEEVLEQIVATIEAVW